MRGAGERAPLTERNAAPDGFRSGRFLTFEFRQFPVNISKYEQRALHALAQGGRILVEKDVRGDILEVACLTRDGWILSDCGQAVFRKLRRRRFIRSENGGPYCITREGLAAVRSQLDNR